MKKTSFVAAAALLLSSGAAFADPVGSSGVRDWSGPYASVGLSYTSTSFSTNTAYNPARATGAGLSVILGYALQDGDLVYGGEALLNFSRVRGSSTGCGLGLVRCLSNVDNYLAVRGRVGMSMGDTLVYGTLGLARDVMSQGPTPGAGASGTHMGLGIGVGAEYAIDANVSIRADLEHYRFQSRTYNFGGLGPTSIRPSHSIARLGISYRF